MDVFLTQGKISRAPALETCIRWDMKLGLYKLTRPKAAANDWIWIADHVVSKGVHKCFVILGVRMSTLQLRDNLVIGLNDVEPIAIVPMRTSNGELVRVELEKARKAIGGISPLAIVADHGSDLRHGGNLFCERHPETVCLYDVTHGIARVYERILREEDAWEAFSTKCANFKKRVQLTELARIAPPNQRTKARFHNIDVLVDWANSHLDLGGEYSKDEKESLAWIQEYKEDLVYWGQAVEIGRLTRKFVREKGYYRGCEEALGTQLLELEHCPRAEEFACEMIDLVQGEGDKLPEGIVAVGTSEIIESLFGKHKMVSGRGPRQMGRLVLTMASRVGEAPSEELIALSHNKIKTIDVDCWVKRSFV